MTTNQPGEPGTTLRRIRRLAVAGAVVATLAGAGFGAGTAMADPLSTPSLTTLAGVGSDTITPLFDEGGINTNDPGGCTPSAPDTGTLAADFNATGPAYPVASWDAVNPCTGTAGETITTKGLSSSDTSCQLERPDGSSAGIAALNDNQTDTNLTASGQTVYCIDYARSSRPPNTTTTDDAFSALAQDALTWAYPVVSGETSPQPSPWLTLAQLEAIYNCTDTNWDQVGGKNAPIGVVLPQSGSGTRASWLLALGITATSEPCWQNGTVTVNGTSYPIEENTGLSPGNVAQFTTTQDFGTTCATGCAPQDDIFPYSIGDWIAQTSPAVNGVGGHATSIWGHGNLDLGKIENAAGTKALAPVTTNSSGQPRINTGWNPAFLRLLYIVTRNGCNRVPNPCLPSTAGGFPGPAPTYEVNGLKTFLHWACHNATAKADIVSYGFTNLTKKTLETPCELTAGD